MPEEEKTQPKETTEEKPKESGGLLDEEDGDEFEEFEEPDWETPAPGTSEAKQWEEDWDDAGWDDEDQDDSFQKRLKEELDKMDVKK